MIPEYFNDMRIDFLHEMKNYAVGRDNMSEEDKTAWIQYLGGIAYNCYFVLSLDLKNSPKEFEGREELEKLLGTMRFFTSRVDNFSIGANQTLIDKIGVEFVEVSSKIQ